MEKYRGSRRAGAKIALVAALGFAIAAPGLFALDLSGRTDTGYRLDYGDNAMINHAWNTHSLELGIMPGLKFSMYGGLQGSFNDLVNTAASGSTSETSDNALRGLLDAYNSPNGKWVDYSLYSASLQYQSSMYGLSIGRTTELGGGLAPYDGISVWAEPLPALHLEAFGGLPWQDPSLLRAAANYQSEIAAGNFEGGASLSTSLLDSMLSMTLGYVYLAQSASLDGTIGAATSIYRDQLLSYSASWMPNDWISAGAGANLMNWTPMSITAWTAGSIDTIHLTYGLNGEVQALDLSGLAPIYDSFSSFLGSSHPYFTVTGNLSEDIGTFIPSGGFLKSLAIDLLYTHRQPLNASDRAMFNPQFDEVSVGPSIGVAGGLSLSASVGYLSTLTDAQATSAYNYAQVPANNSLVIGGEIREKAGAFDFRLGGSYGTNDFQSNYSTTISEGIFNYEGAYFKAKWQVTKAFDLSARASWDATGNILATQTLKYQDPSLWPVYTPSSTELNNQTRSSVHLEIQTGFRY